MIRSMTVLIKTSIHVIFSGILQDIFLERGLLTQMCSMYLAHKDVTKSKWSNSTVKALVMGERRCSAENIGKSKKA